MTVPDLEEDDLPFPSVVDIVLVVIAACAGIGVAALTIWLYLSLPR